MNNQYSFDLTPDADFEKRIAEIGKQSVISPPKEDIFSFIPISPDFLDSQIEERRAKIGRILSTWSPVSEDEKIQKSDLVSQLEEKFPLYIKKFQDILQIPTNASLKEKRDRYARILLYILENFYVKGDKKQHVEFMISLKKVLNEIDNYYEEKAYRNRMLEVVPIPLTDVREEIELLYRVYSQNYFSLKHEVHVQEQEHRKLLIHTMKTIEIDMLWADYRDEEYWSNAWWQPAWEQVRQDIEQRRQYLREQREKRMQQKRNGELQTGFPETKINYRKRW